MRGYILNILSETVLLRNGIELVAPDEYFKQVNGFNKYFFSNYGRLAHKSRKGKYTIVNPSITKGGYLSYTLSKPTRKYNGEKVRNSNGNLKEQISKLE